jgi:ABC-type polysaccharide/polyol phosphate export permease
LLLQWIRRDFLVRYRQSALGVGWALLQPALLLLFYGFVFVNVLHVRVPGANYAVFAYCGLAPWTFISNALLWGTNSLAASAGVIKQVYFPREIVPLAAGGVMVVDLCISTVVLLVLQLCVQGGLHLAVLGLIPLFAALVLVVEGVVVFFAVFGALVRDLRFVIPLLIQVGFVATPVMYPTSQGGHKWSAFYSLNPLTHVIGAVRQAVLYGHWPSGILLLASFGIGVGVLVAASLYCGSIEGRLPDLL